MMYCSLCVPKLTTSFLKQHFNLRLQQNYPKSQAVLLLSYESHPESKERFVIPRYSIIIQKLNIQILAHTFVYLSTQSPLTLRRFLYLSTSLYISFSYHVASDSILQVFIICEAFTRKVLLHFWKQEKVRRCQVRTVRRMLKDIPMELLT